jgi:UDPglucose--hexose-1-phosphate uridylyltransferase
MSVAGAGGAPVLYRRALVKPDGRHLFLYARRPLPSGLAAPAPGAGGASETHLRWHPLRGEWVVYATHRQHRTFLPAQDPLAITDDPERPTELPAGPWEVAVFENLFPAMSQRPGPPPATIVETAPACGLCEVVVFTQDPTTSLGGLPLDRIHLIIDVWADRTAELGRLPDVAYVFPFENRGVEVGVTLHHPHGQIYAYPFVPPVPARELENQRAYWDAHQRGLLVSHIDAEIADGRRMVYASAHSVAFVPAFARYPYEVWIAPRRPAQRLPELTAAERRELARALKTVLMKYDALWQRPFPYLLALHQAPTDGAPHPEAHLHIELYPAYRMPGRLKYLASSEMGAGVFTADTAPEDTARELREVDVDVDVDAA